MASFGGVPIFGVSLTMQAAVINPIATQTNEYPGLNGIEELTQGKRGGVTMARGRLWGVDPYALNVLEMIFRSFYDGFAYVLEDQYGNLWPWVKLETYQPSGKILRYADGSCSREYEARFKHLTIPDLS